MVRCSDNSLYTGYTGDVERRLLEHNSGRGSKYVMSRLPVFLVYYEDGFKTRSEAMRRESAIKKLRKVDKERLIIYSKERE